jgi:hypothetical protein
MMSFSGIVFGFIGLLLSVIVGMPIVFGMLLDNGCIDVCDTKIHETINQEGGNAYVVLFERECGTTVGFNKQVSLCPPGAEFSLDRCPPFLVINENERPNIRWIGPKTLEVTLPSASKIIRKLDTTGEGVSILYR